jgi:hypothetical protein
MKKTLITIVFLFALINISAQNYVAKTIDVRFSNIDNEKWTEWSAPDAVSVVIMEDTASNSFKIFSSELIEFTVIQYSGWDKTNTGVDIYVINCVDDGGIRCDIWLGKLDEDNFFQINYSDFIIHYRVKLLKWLEQEK